MFKQSVDLTKQAAAVQRVLSEITPLNAGKKRDGASVMLGKFFPRLESLARCLLPKLQAYYESEEGQKALAEWEEKQNQGKDK